MQQPVDAHDPPEWLRYSVEEAMSDRTVASWIPTGRFDTSSLRRVPRYPASIAPESDRSLTIDTVRNERRSGQLAIATTERLDAVHADVTDFEGTGDSTLPSSIASVRFVGYVPVEESHASRGSFAAVENVSGNGLSGDRAPDLVADPLFPLDSVTVPASRAQPIWVTFEIPTGATAGEYTGEITLADGERELANYTVELTVRDVTLPDPADGEFYLDVWLHPDAVASEHDVEAWSTEHWELLEAYLDDLARASQRTITAPIVHEPWQRRWLGGTWRPQTATGYSSMVEWRYDGGWSFGFDRFDRYVETALEHGVGPSISAYSMLVFRGPQRLSYTDADGEFVVDRCEAGDDRWRSAWTAFLEAFGDHLADRGWRDQTYLAFDERPSDLMEAAMDVIESASHDFEERIRIAGSPDVTALATDLSVHYHDFPLDDSMVEARRERGQSTTFYVAHPIAHPRDLSYSPAIETRMLPWIAAATGLDGYLRWSYNAWPDDVFENPVFRYPQGAEYYVYPGRDGPLSSIRWELLREGIGEFELAQMAGKEAVADALDIASRDPDGRAKDPTDLSQAREDVLEQLD